MERAPTRRRILRAASIGAVGGIAGCSAANDALGGVLGESGKSTMSAVRWSYGQRSVGGPPAGGPETAYVVGAGLTALALADGTEQWHVGGDYGPPAATRERVYVPDRGSGGVAAYRASDGQTVFDSTQETGSESLGRPALGRDAVYVTSESGIYAVDAGDGSVRWSHAAGEVWNASDVPGDGGCNSKFGVPCYAASSPTVSGETVYASGGDVVAFDAAEGTVQWRYDAETRRWEDSELDRVMVSRPAVVGDTVVVGRAFGDVIGLAASDGTERWRIDVGWRAGSHQPAALDGAAFVVTEPSNQDRYTLTVLSGSDGSVEYREGGRNPPRYGPPRAGRDAVYVVDQTGTLHVLADAPRREVEVGLSSEFAPAVAGETVLVTSDGTLYALDPSGGGPPGSGG